LGSKQNRALSVPTHYIDIENDGEFALEFIPYPKKPVRSKDMENPGREKKNEKKSHWRDRVRNE